VFDSNAPTAQGYGSQAVVPPPPPGPGPPGAPFQRKPAPIGIIVAAITGLVMLIGIGVAMRPRPHHDDQADYQPPADAAIEVDASIPDPPADPAPPPPKEPTSDPWAATGKPGAGYNFDGYQQVWTDVGQGVKFQAPGSYQLGKESNFITAHNIATDVWMAIGPITSKTDDLMDIVNTHARAFTLRFDRMQAVNAFGQQRTALLFQGQHGQIQYRQVVLPLIGRGYRMLAVFQAPMAKIDRPEVQQQETELFNRRLTVPSPLQPQ
jgi:hypothetical protein